MKVLYLTNIPAPYRVDFFNELGKYCDLTVLFERSSARDRDDKWQVNQAVNYKAVFMKGIKIGNDSAFCIEVLKYLNKSFDHIVIGGYSTPTGMLAINFLKMKKLPFYLSADGGMIKEEKKVIYLFKKYFISSADCWLSTSEKTTQYFMYYGAKKDKIWKYPFTSLREVDILPQIPTLKEKLEIRKQLNIKEDKVIVSVGRMIPGKGFDILIEAVKELSNDLGIYIVGGSPLNELIEQKERYNLQNVHFINFISKDEVSEYYKAADLFVLPTRGDVWGLVINEAMAKGLPVITTDKCVAGLELIQDNYNGFLVPVENSKVLKEKILEILNDNKSSEFMKKNNIKTIKKYTIEKMAEKHREIFEKNKIRKD